MIYHLHEVPRIVKFIETERIGLLDVGVRRNGNDFSG